MSVRDVHPKSVVLRVCSFFVDSNCPLVFLPTLVDWTKLLCSWSWIHWQPFGM